MDDDTDDKDDTKRKSRNLSEKKRRDQFNLLINELSSMVSNNSRKMDKSTVLKSTISFLKNHNDLAVRSRAHEIQEEWKPAFLSNEEFTHLILEALDGFIMVFSSSGRILYTSESIASLLGHLPDDLMNMTIYDIVIEEDHSQLYNMFLNPVTNVLYESNNQVSFMCHCKHGSLDGSVISYELVKFVGYFRADMESLQVDNSSSNNRFSSFSAEMDTRLVFVGTGRLQTPQLLREMSIVDSTKNEFTSRHSLEWKFLFLDHRASQIIGYLPFEVLGTSGYDYYHVDDLDKVVICHEALMQKGEGTSCYYRFLTKGQQWIWLQTRFYITYHQWNSKPEFVVCTHRVISHINVVKHTRKDPDSTTEQSPESDFARESFKREREAFQQEREASPWPSNANRSSPGDKNSQFEIKTTFPRGAESDNSMSADSMTSRHPHLPMQRSRCVSTTGGKMAAPTHTSKATAMSDFVEPPVTYSVAAIPLQPVAFTTPTTIVTTPEVAAGRQPLVMSAAQTQIQDQLQKKHEQLQQLIVQQQEELRRVSEQLFMARYGLLSPLINVTMPYSVPASAPHLTVAAPSPDMFLSAQRPHIVVSDSHQVNYQQAQSSDEGIFPFPQQQAQLLFPQGLDSPNSTQQSQ